MNAIWTFEHDRLIARNPAGGLLHWLLADQDMGRTLAHLLNANPALGRILLPPWGQ
jgi:hypothetical protein